MRLPPLLLLAALAACAPEARPQDAQAAPASPPAAAPASSEAPPPGPRLVLPVACRIGAGCEVQNYVDLDPGPGVRDYRCGRRGYDKHGGVDIRLPDLAAQQ